MQTTQLQLNSLIGADGKVDESYLPQLRELVARYPYYHAARILFLRLLYQQRDSDFTNELRRAALYLPSRSRIYQEIEGESMRPTMMKKTFTGATQARKSHTPLGDLHQGTDRTEQLIGSFLSATPSVLYDVRSGRPVDACTDYMSYLMQEEASRNNAKAVVTEEVEKEKEDEAGTSGHDLIGSFIASQGDRRVQLQDRKDSELQKPAIASETSSQQGAFTETLARIYIKQGKFEQAIEIIRRLSLKYPKKNRYFADQIRFLEKLIVINQAK